jgi:hypothetical protein
MDERTFVLYLTFSGSEGVTRTCVLWTLVPHGNRKADRYCGRKQCDMSLPPATMHTAFRHCYYSMVAFSILLSRGCINVAPSVINVTGLCEETSGFRPCVDEVFALVGLFRSASQ